MIIYRLFSKKNLLFRKCLILLTKIILKFKVFTFNFDIFDGSIGCATKFHAKEIIFLSP